MYNDIGILENNLERKSFRSSTFVFQNSNIILQLLLDRWKRKISRSKINLSLNLIFVTIGPPFSCRQREMHPSRYHCCTSYLYTSTNTSSNIQYPYFISICLPQLSYCKLQMVSISFFYWWWAFLLQLFDELNVKKREKELEYIHIFFFPFMLLLLLLLKEMKYIPLLIDSYYQFSLPLFPIITNISTSH